MMRQIQIRNRARAVGAVERKFFQRPVRRLGRLLDAGVERRLLISVGSRERRELLHGAWCVDRHFVGDLDPLATLGGGVWIPGRALRAAETERPR